MISLLIASALTSSISCTTTLLRVMPSYTAYREVCVVHRGNQRPVKRVKVIRVLNKTSSPVYGDVPEVFVIPQSDR